MAGLEERAVADRHLTPNLVMRGIVLGFGMSFQRTGWRRRVPKSCSTQRFRNPTIQIQGLEFLVKHGVYDLGFENSAHFIIFLVLRKTFGRVALGKECAPPLPPKRKHIFMSQDTVKYCIYILR